MNIFLPIDLNKFQPLEEYIMKKYVVFLSIMGMQICLGGLYAWSSFVRLLVTGYDLTVSQTQIIFGLTVSVWTLSLIIAGKCLSRYGPKLTGTISGLLFGSGYLVASLSKGSFWVILLGIALLGGTGIGFGYICPLSTSGKWFPRKLGLLTGLSMASFGVGAVVLSTIANRLLTMGIDVLDIFKGLGFFYGFLIILVSRLLTFPYKTQESRGLLRVSSAIKTKAFWQLTVAFFCGTFAGITINGNLGPMGQTCGLTSGGVTLAVSLFAIGNTLGRLVWGYLHQQFGANTIGASLVFLAIGLLGFNFFLY